MGFFVARRCLQFFAYTQNYNSYRFNCYFTPSLHLQLKVGSFKYIYLAFVLMVTDLHNPAIHAINLSPFATYWIIILWSKPFLHLKHLWRQLQQLARLLPLSWILKNLSLLLLGVAVEDFVDHCVPWNHPLVPYVNTSTGIYDDGYHRIVYFSGTTVADKNYQNIKWGSVKTHTFGSNPAYLNVFVEHF